MATSATTSMNTAAAAAADAATTTTTTTTTMAATTRRPRPQVKQGLMSAKRTISSGTFNDLLVGTVDETGKEVAIKRFHGSRRARAEMEHEVAVLHALQQSAKGDAAGAAGPLFASFVVLMLCVDWNTNAIGLELCEGGDLFGLLAQNEELDESDILFYAAEIAAAISHLHSKNILHGDIKPENVGITGQGHVRLFDFGLSHVFDPVNDRDPLTGRLVVASSAGTTIYASPELLSLRQSGMDGDWWSYGVLLFEVLFQRLPWLGDTDAETAALICTEPLSWLDDDKDYASPEAVDLVEGLLGSKVPAFRLTHDQGFAALQARPFFASVDWSRLAGQGYLPPFQLSP